MIFTWNIRVTNAEDAPKSTQLLAATTLRKNVLGSRTLHEILADRESQVMQLKPAVFTGLNVWLSRTHSE